MRSITEGLATAGFTAIETMITIEITERDGTLRTVSSESGITLLEAIRNAGIYDLLALCGGCCSCATCHVYIDPNWFEQVGAPGATEEEMLNIVSEPRDNSRLACQITLTDALNGLVVGLPEAQH